MACIVFVTVNSIEYCFDFDAQRIDVPASVDELGPDIWQAIKDAHAEPRAMAFPVIATGSGLNELSAGTQTFLTVTLLDNWEINSLKSGGKFTVNGFNLIRADGGDPFLDNPLITYINFLSQAGTASTVAVGSAVLPSDITAIAEAAAEAVWTDLTTRPTP